MFFKIDKECFKIISLSIGFTILFATEDTFKNIEKIIVSSIADDKPGFKAEGYTLTGIKYTVFCVSLWISPYLTYTIGARPTVVLSSLCFVYYIASYAIEEVWALYSGVVILGIAEGTIAPPEAQYLIENSEYKNIPRNIFIFFSLQKTALLFGNIFVFFTFRGKMYINQVTRKITIYGLMFAVISSTIAFMFLPKSTGKNKNDFTLTKTMKICWKMLKSPDILWLLVACSYTGLQQSFGEGIYGPSIGFTLAFGDSAKELVALSGVSKSVGGFLGVLYPMLLFKFIKKQILTRKLTFLSGIVAELITFLIAYINLPNSANSGNTEEISFINPSIFLALLGSLLLSFGEACFATQIYGFFADFYHESSGEGTILYKSVRNVFVALSYYSGNHIGLHTQVAILACTAVAGAASYWFAEHISESSKIKTSSPEQS